MRFSGVTLALISPVKLELVYPVAPDKTNRSVQSLSTTIPSGAGNSGWVI